MAAASADLDGDADCNTCVLVVTGEGIGAGVRVLVIGEGVLLPSTLALTLRLTPTLPQICCAKARTSGENIPGQSIVTSGSFHTALLP